MRFLMLPGIVFLLTGTAIAQRRYPSVRNAADTSANRLKEVVVTGQYGPQSLRNSIYQTRIISSERIRLRAATNIQQVLNTELGFRFSNDLTLGTADVQLMGISGRNVKILLDGVPLVDRNDTRESLNQIDINTIDHIEIVEGPLSVSYGTDALGGVINIISKAPGREMLNLNARIQEETVGTSYSPFDNEGSHLQHVGGSWQKQSWSVMAGGTRNAFGGYNVPGAMATAAEIASNVNRWKPKDQWLANTRLGYNEGKFGAWYTLNYLDETIDSRGGYNPNIYRSTNQQYITDRLTQQLHADYLVNERLQLSSSFGYSTLKRTTKTTVRDFTTGEETLSTGAGEQDISKFKSGNIRTTAQYKLNGDISFQPGVEINLDKADGARIKGSPAINDYAFFISSELMLMKVLSLRPGLRFIHNTVYDAPPVIPSLNAKLKLSNKFDIRSGYARGFRSPALRELYYDFVDASHAILGNENLKAEQSNSFNTSLTFTDGTDENTCFRSVLSGFYNHFRNRIDYGLDAANPGITTLINIGKYKTTGGTFENFFYLRNMQLSLGASYIGTYNQYSDDEVQFGESPVFVWTPELNTNFTYRFPKSATTINLAFKYTGRRPAYELATVDGEQQVRLSKIGSFSTADLMFTQPILSMLTLNAGVKILFDTKTLSNSAVATTGAHSTGGAVPLSYGRSYVLGLSFNLNK